MSTHGLDKMLSEGGWFNRTSRVVFRHLSSLIPSGPHQNPSLPPKIRHPSEHRTAEKIEPGGKSVNIIEMGKENGCDFSEEDLRAVYEELENTEEAFTRCDCIGMLSVGFDPGMRMMGWRFEDRKRAEKLAKTGMNVEWVRFDSVLRQGILLHNPHPRF